MTERKDERDAKQETRKAERDARQEERQAGRGDNPPDLPDPKPPTYATYKDKPVMDEKEDGVRKHAGLYTNNPNMDKYNGLQHPGPQGGWLEMSDTPDKPEDDYYLPVYGMCWEPWVAKAIKGSTDPFVKGYADKYPEVIEIRKKFDAKYPPIEE